MRTLAVHWHEGMFLRPHHFQAADRYWADQLHQSSRLDQWFNWGIRKIDIDANALKTSRFVVRQLLARLRDGTVIRVPQDAMVRELTLPQRLFDNQNSIEISLAVPTLEIGRANVGGANDEGIRYRIETPPGGVPDEATGQNARPLQYRRLNLTLLMTGQDPAGYETLPLATLTRSAQGDASPQLARQKIPSILACDAWPAIREDILQPIYFEVTRLCKEIGETVCDREITFADTDPDSRRMLEQVQLLNESMAITRALARTDGIHPFGAYMELARLLGQLAIFGPSRIFPELEFDYDHDSPGDSLFELKRHIDEMLRWIGADRKFQQRPFIGKGLQMQVEMDEPWLAPGWQMFVGVDSNLQPPEVIRLLTAGGTNMKIASSDRVEQVYATGQLGLSFKHEPQQPRVLPSGKNLSYFSVDTSNKNEWPFVQKTRRVAIRLNERLLDGDLEAKRDMVLRGQAGKQPTLRFTLYVVPPKG